MMMTKWNGLELKIQADRWKAQRSAPYRDACNDAARCPGLYSGHGEPPRFRKSFGSSIDAGDLERRLQAREERDRAVGEDSRHA